MDKFETDIRPPAGISLGLKELWQYRELFYFFTWRDIKVKYKQAVLGVLWAILQPLGMMLLLTFIFSRTLKIDSGILPYPVFVLSGLLCWGLFSSSLSHAAESMVQHAGIIKKIYFPRLIIPASAILAALFDFVMALIVFTGICIYYRQPVSAYSFIFIPAAVILLILAALGAGSLLAALNVKYRDFRYVVPFLLQVLFFATQVVYPFTSVTPAWLKQLLALNPVNGAVELFRAGITGLPPDAATVYISSGSAILLLLTGIFYFRKTESFFADIA